MTLITGLATGSPLTRIFSSGGFDPFSALAVTRADGLADLLVANRGDGSIALLQGGPLGLTLDDDSRVTGMPTASALALASVHNDTLEVYSVSPGEEAATLLAFALSPSESSSGSGGSGSSLALTAGVQGLTLVSFREASLPLLATLSATVIEAETEGQAAGSGASTPVEIAALGSTASGFGQGPLADSLADDDSEGDGGDLPPDPQVADESAEAPSSWHREALGLEAAFDEYRRSAFSKPRPEPVPAPARGVRIRILPPASVRPESPVDAAAEARDIVDAQADNAPPTSRPGIDDGTPRGPGPAVSPVLFALMLTGLMLTPDGPSGRFRRRAIRTRSDASY